MIDLAFIRTHFGPLVALLVLCIARHRAHGSPTEANHVAIPRWIARTKAALLQ